MLLHQVAHYRQAFAQLLLRAATVHRQFPHPRPDLLLEAADALHEELVQIGADDGQEFHPLQQGNALVLSLVQHPPVERQPGQLAVQIPFGGFGIDRRRWGLFRRGDDHGHAVIARAAAAARSGFDHFGHLGHFNGLNRSLGLFGHHHHTFIVLGCSRGLIQVSARRRAPFPAARTASATLRCAHGAYRSLRSASTAPGGCWCAPPCR